MAGLVDGRRTRTAAGALLEMSILAKERERLDKELAAAGRRRAEIEARLSEISQKERRLQEFVKNPVVEAATNSAPTVEMPLNVKTREFSY